MPVKFVGALSILLLLSTSAIAHELPSDEPAAEAPEEATGEHTSDTAEGVLGERFKGEKSNAFNPYLVSTHKQNYVLPVSYTSNLNTRDYETLNEEIPGLLRREEVKFQLSLKVPLNQHRILLENDTLFLGFTLEAWWQLYSKDVSSPFRETNYQPEIFYVAPLGWQPWGGSTTFIVGFEHQSNGQSQGLSRSWNRLYTGLLYEKGNFFTLIRPWYRIPEKEKEMPLSPRGDDNPDIHEFMGNGDVTLGFRHSRYEFAATLRGNPATGKGAAELAMSFPLFSRFRGIVQYFNGYGDALIDYDHFQQRIGIGVLLSNLF